MRLQIRYSCRLFDPINYKECCFFIAQEDQYISQKKYTQNLSYVELLVWLGSNCGQYFLRCANKLIEEYPYKEKAPYAIVMGKIVDQETVDNHKIWLKEKLSQTNFLK